MRSIITSPVLFLSTLLALAQIISALSLSGFQKPLGQVQAGQPTTSDDDKDAVPGDNPLRYCPSAKESDFLVIEHVNMDPNPPLAYVHHQSSNLKDSVVVTVSSERGCREN